MTNYIGPIQTENIHIKNNDLVKNDGSESINLVCTVKQAHQLLGLCDDVTKNSYGPLRILSSKSNRWGPLPVRTSENLKINEHFTHEGYFLLRDIEFESLGGRDDIIIASVDAERITKNVNDFLKVNYSRGGLSGGEIEHGYDDEVKNIVLEDTFDGAYTTNWTVYDSYNLSSSSVSTSGGKLVLTGVNGTGWGGLNIDSKNTFKPPFEVEFDLEYVSGTNHNMSVYLVETVPHPWSDLTVHAPITNYIRIYLFHHDGGLYYAVLKCVRGVISYLVPEKALNISTEKNPNFKIKYDEGGMLTVWIDKTGGTNFGEPVWGPGPTQLEWSSPGFCYNFDNVSGASQTMKSRGFKVSQIESANYPNIVMAPPGAICNLAPDFFRESEEGLIQCFKDITDNLIYQISPNEFYKGSVKGLNTKYGDDVSRLVTGNNFDLDPNKFILTNGLVRLVPGSQSVDFQFWDGVGWTTLNTFTLPRPIRLIKPSFVGKDRFILQIDRTFWEMRSGRYGIWVEHPYDDIGYTKRTSVYHDGVIHNGLADGADVSMLTQFYSLIFNPYNLLTVNQYGIETDTSGWTAISSTLSQQSGGTYGNYLRSVTSNLVTNEGFQQSPLSSLPVIPATGLIVSGRAMLSGSGTVILSVIERDSGGSFITSTSTSTITLSSTPTLYNISHSITSPNARYVNLQCYTVSKQSATIEGDMFQLAPSPVANQPMYSGSPLAANRYGMMIMKKNPTTIKSNIIPASEITGIGVYDQMQPPLSNDYYQNLAREWFKPTSQNLTIEEV